MCGYWRPCINLLLKSQTIVGSLQASWGDRKDRSWGGIGITTAGNRKLDSMVGLKEQLGGF